MANDGTVKIGTDLDASGLKKGLQSLGTVASGALKGVGTAVAAVGTGLTALITKATMAAGELEQNIGGAESVFGELGDTISEMTTVMQTYDKELGQVVTSTASLEDVAQSAFKNMGLSTSDFLATANKMGALFQGSGFTAQESLDLSAKAMQRAADVASIMGIDTASALEAVTGAAKGNFTMMDNLGVAMNATTIEAFAFSKGIKTAYKDMDNQQKVGLAMELFLEKTAYAAGNYSKENMTLAGSLGTAKAALTNFLDGSGDVDALVGAFTDAADVIIANVTEIAPRIIDGLSQIAEKAVPMIPGLIEQVIPIVMDGVTGILDAVIGMVPSLVSGLAVILPQFAGIIGQLIDVIIDTLPEFLDAAAELIYAILDGLVGASSELVPEMLEIVFALIDVIIDTLPEFIEVAGQMIVAIVRGLVQSLPELVEKAPELIDALIDALIECLPLLLEVGVDLIWELLKGLYQTRVMLMKKAPDIIDSLIQGIYSCRIKLLLVGENIVKGIWEGISGAGGWLKQRIEQFANSVVESIKAFFGIQSPSVVMEKEVGAMITAGLAKGITATTTVAIRAMKRMGDKVLSASKTKEIKSLVNNTAASVAKSVKENGKTVTKDVETYNSDILASCNQTWTNIKNGQETSLADEVRYWQEVRKLLQKGTTARMEADAAYAAALKERNEAISDYNAEAVAMQKGYFADVQAINDDLAAAVDAAWADYDAAVQDRADSLYNALGGLFDGFSSSTENTTDILIENLRSQVTGLVDWAAEMEKLEERIDNESLISELQKLGPNAAADLAVLNQMTDAQLSEYVALWQSKTDICSMLATDEMSGLKDETLAIVDELIADSDVKLLELEDTFVTSMQQLAQEAVNEIGSLPVEFRRLGIEIGDALANGISSCASAVRAAAAALADAALGTSDASDLAAAALNARSAAGSLGGGFASGESRTVNVTQNFYSQTTSSFDAYKGAVLVV